MIDIDELYDIINKDKVIFRKEKMDFIRGFCITLNDLKCICLNSNIDNKIEEKSVLLEEISHYKAGIIPSCPYGTDYYNKLIRSKNEYRAIKYLVNNFMPREKINLFYNPYKYKYEIAEELGITEQLLDRIYDYLKGDDTIWQEQCEKEGKNGTLNTCMMEKDTMTI